MNYCIMRSKKKENTAGNKAPDDIVQICRDNGFEIIHWKQFPNNSSVIYKKVWLLTVCNFQWLYLLMKTKKQDLVLYQHPSYGYRNGILWLKLIKKKKVKTIALIHDLESLRKGIVGGVSYSKKRSKLADTIFLKMFDAIICHNEHMKQYLISQGFASDKLFNLEIFDYLSNVDKVQSEKGATPSIAIAGNLSSGKCGYIYNIFENGNNRGLKVNLYGINFQEEKANSNLVYQGSFKPEELPKKLEGDFGLVWDGNSAETCTGNTGEYLKFNNPHKTSLYLSSGMPIIVWSQAAIADFVLQNGVGITVHSLSELEERIRSMSKDEYNMLKDNALRICQRLRNGYYTKKAINEVIDAFGNS